MDGIQDILAGQEKIVHERGRDLFDSLEGALLVDIRNMIHHFFTEVL